MKKIIIVLLIMFFPIFIYAQEIEKVDITVPSKASINSNISVSFDLTFSGLNAKSTNGYGIGGYTFQLDFDDTVLVPASIEKNEFFNINLYKDENKKYHVIATINKDNKSKKKCADNVLYCSNIKNTIVFNVKSTSLTKTNIKVFAVSAYLYKVNSELKDTDRLIIDSIKDVNKDIKIVKSNLKSSNTKNISSKIQTKEIEKTVESRVQDYKILSDSKSNNYLSALEIEGYDISFDKHILTYDLSVNTDVSNIVIKATSENEKAKIEIKGNDDLNQKENIVEIIVTAEDKSKKTYKINVIKESQNEEEIPQEIETKEDIKNLYNDIKKKLENKETIKLLEIIGVILFGIIVFVVIVKVIMNRKLNKKIKKFEDF